MRTRRLAIVAAVALLACPGPAAGQPAPGTGRPAGAAGPVLRLGALVPLRGPGAWFGTEIKQGLELAVAELDPSPRPGASPGDPSSLPAQPTGLPAPAAGPQSPPAQDAVSAESDPPAPADGGDPSGAAAPGDLQPKGPPPEPVEPADRPRTIGLALQALDVQPLDLQAAGTEMNRLLASGVAAVITASPTPTLAVHPLAAARNVLVLHAGLPTDRLPAASRTLLQLRPSVGTRAEILAAHARERGLKRLALLAAGDDFGRAVRTGVAGRWRKAGGQLVHEESMSLDAADLRSRLRSVTRTGPDAVVLGYEGAALGEAARALRQAGYAGPLLAVDDDRAALLAGGPALDGALVLSDEFVPVPGSRGARFARAYEARHGQPPSRFAASAYEAAVLLADAAAGALRGGSLSGARLREALVAGRRFPSLYAGDVLVHDDGTLGRPLALFRVDGSRLTFESYVGTDGHPLAPPPASDATPLRSGLLLP
jgi:branched-chain amino acid transport system substrate-binding protein